MPDLHHVYHLYADGGWEQAWEEHIEALNLGLIGHLSTFSIGLVGSPENRAIARQCVENSGATVVVEEDSGWEQVTLKWLHDQVATLDGFVLYCHSKGAGYPNGVSVPWRRTMTSDVVIGWEESVKLLDSYEAVGGHWHYPSDETGPVGYFAGNFWWARCEAIAELDEPEVIHRFAAEGWLGTNLEMNIMALREGSFSASGPWDQGWITKP